MTAIQVKPGIYWVGAKDWNVRDFHGYVTPRGTTYNAYLIIDEKIVLVDTVKKGHEPQMLERIRSVIDPAKIDIIVSNHVEMDHSGGVSEVLKHAPNAEVITCPVGKAGLEKHYQENWKFRVVKSGESISIGKRTLNFVQTPLVHWPDSMVTYMPEDKLLFSNDAFGHHLAPRNIFDDEMPKDILFDESAKYYANIVMPYGKQVQGVLKALGSLDVDMILPSHGIIWRKNVKEIIEAYNNWSLSKNDGSALVVYDSMWQSTEALANTVLQEFEKKNIPVVMRSLKYTHMSEIMTDVLKAKYVAIGSPILNNQIFPSMAGFLTYMRGLKPADKKGIIFGSFGWNPAAYKELYRWLKEELHWDMLMDPFSVKWVPTQDEKSTLLSQLSDL